MTGEEGYDRSDVLLLAITRPALVAGVPLEAMATNLFVTFFAGMELQAPVLWRSPFILWALIGIPTHMILKRLTAWDFNWCRTLRLWGLTFAWLSLEAMPTRRPVSGREIPSSV